MSSLLISENINTIFFGVNNVLFSKGIDENKNYKYRLENLLKNKGYDEKKILLALKNAKKFSKKYLLMNSLINWKEEKKYKYNYAKVLVQSLNEKNNELVEEIICLMNDLNLYKLYPDVIEVLAKCKSKNYKLGVICNARPSILWAFDNLDIRKYFDAIIISSIEQEEKPNKEIYLKALERVKSKAEECLFIDRSIKNIKGAESCGINTIKINRKNQTLNSLLGI